MMDGNCEKNSTASSMFSASRRLLAGLDCSVSMCDRSGTMEVVYRYATLAKRAMAQVAAQTRIRWNDSCTRWVSLTPRRVASHQAGRQADDAALDLRRRVTRRPATPNTIRPQVAGSGTLKVIFLIAISP